MSLPLLIRDAGPADRPTLVRFIAELQEVERALQPDRTDGPAIADKHLAYLETLVQTQQGRIFIAEQNGELLGCLVCFVEALDPGDLHIITSERCFGFISDLYVIPAGRRSGVGTALLQAAEVHFTALGLAVVHLNVLYKNQVACRVYEQNGYAPYELVYAKRLAPAGSVP